MKNINHLFRFLLFIFINCSLLITNCFSQYGWFQVYSGVIQNLNAVHFMNASTGLIVGDDGIILRTTNYGFNWTVVPLQPPIADSFFDVYFDIGTDAHMVSDSGGIYRSTNSGLNWVKQTSGTNLRLNGIFFIDGNTGFVAGNSRTALYTTNDGSVWNMFPATPVPVNFFDPGSEPFAGVVILGGESIPSGGTLQRTTNMGMNWITDYYGPNKINTVVLQNSNTGYAAGANGMILKTTNGGTNWNPQVSPIPVEIVSLSLVSANPLTLYGCGLDGAIIKTTNGGTNWFTQLSPVPHSFFDVYFIDEYKGFICGSDGTILMTTTGGVTFVEQKNTEIPNEFILFQNYPNPFNPVTNIKFQVARTAEGKWQTAVRLIVYDALGREIASLVNEQLKAGTYQVDWDASNNANGVYFYRIMAGDFISTKRMVLLK